MVQNLPQKKDELTKYYQDLLPLQYIRKQNARGDIAVRVQNITGDYLMLDMWKYFDIDTAAGAQLDLIGKIVGLGRNADGFDLANDYFSYNDISNQMPIPQGFGFSDIGSPNPVIFRDINQVKRTIYAMTDTQYRTMLKLRIIINNAINTNKYIDDSLYRIFGTGIIATNNYDMTMTLTIQPQWKFIGQLAEYLGLFPAPLGVGIEYIYL